MFIYLATFSSNILIKMDKKDIKVLLVDNEKYDRELFTEWLNDIDYINFDYIRIEQAVDGNEALKIAPEYKPHLVLMDTNMPGGPEGYEVCKEMRTKDYGKNIAIIGMSAKKEEKPNWTNTGNDDFFIKSQSREVLEKKINDALKKHFSK